VDPEETDVLFLPGFEYWLVGHRTRKLVTIPTEIYCHRTNGVVKLSLCLSNSLRHEGVWGSGYLDPHFLDLGTSWRCRFNPGE
jgi:hypothetical protein